MVGRKLVVLAICVAVAALLPMFFTNTSAKNPIIAIVYDNSSFENAAKGCEDALRDKIPTVIIDIQNAEDEPDSAKEIARNQLFSKPDAIISIGPNSTQYMMELRKDTNIIGAFMGMGESESQSLVSKANIVAMTHRIDIQKILQASKIIFPQGVNIGFPTNMVAPDIANQLKLASDKLKMKLVSIPPTNDLRDDIEQLSKIADMIYLCEEDVDFADSLQTIPVICDNNLLVSGKAIISVEPDYYDDGLRLGNMVADKIESKSKRNKLQNSHMGELKINYEFLEKFGINRDRIESLTK